MRNRCVIIVVAAGIFVISCWFGIEMAMTPTQVNLLEKTQTPTELEIYHLGTSYTYKNNDVIDSLTSLMRNKVARIARNQKYKKFRSLDAELTFEYGYKGRSFFVDDEGRIIAAYRKFEFARDSWFIPYRLIWNSNAEIICYVTDPDQSVKALVNQIKKEMKIK